MTKTKLGQVDGKPTGPTPTYTAVRVDDTEQPGAPGVNKLPGTTCWYVCGILSTIFCCLPCGVVGMVHAMIAKHEGERGNLPAYRRRMRQAKCWTCWSIILGLLTITALVLYTIGVTIGFRGAYYWVCGNSYWYDDIIYPMNDTMYNYTDYAYQIDN